MSVSFVEKVDHFSINHIFNNQNDYIEDGDDVQKLILNLFNNSAGLAAEISTAFQYFISGENNNSNQAYKTVVDMENFNKFFDLYQNNKLNPYEITEEQIKLLKCKVYITSQNGNNKVVVFDIEGDNILKSQMPSKLNFMSYKIH